MRCSTRSSGTVHHDGSDWECRSDACRRYRRALAAVFAHRDRLRPAREPRTSDRVMKPVPRQAPRVRKPSVWFELARRAACSLAGVEERVTATGPEFRIGPKLLARLDEDGVSLLTYIGADEREMLTEAEPRTFSDVLGRRGHPTLRVHLAYVDEGSLRRILEQSWRERAPKRLQRSPTSTA
jgi:hypothetical protein